MENLPSDPFMLLSYVNTKLRDNFSSLDELCASLDVNRGDLENKLKSAGFEYNDSLNKFW
jgi:hypothetical protein